MATSVFTTWAAFRDFLLDKLASGDPSVASVRVGNGPGAKEITYRPEALSKLLAYAEQRAAAEEAAGSPTLRTYAHQGGRGE
jgi:hypothetical protein